MRLPAIALAQINPAVGDIDGNVNLIVDAWGKAEGADLVVFPEMALCGYQAEDLFQHSGFLDACANGVHRLIEESRARKSAILFGAPYVEDSAVYNAALLINRGAATVAHRKVHLPNYGVFDDPRVFTSGPLADVKPIDFNGFKLGVMICEDMWFDDVAAAQAQRGADILVALLGSPFTPSKHGRRLELARGHVKKTSLPLAMVNLAGGQDQLVFDGASFAMDADGTVTAQLAFTQSDLSFIDSKTIQPVPDGAAALHDAAVLAVRDYFGKNGIGRALIGFSGGIDSAVVAALAARALGAGNVHTIMMPTRFTSPESLEDAAACAKLLGCTHETVAIDPLLAAYETALPGLTGLAHENIQARIRGAVLMARSNETGALVLATGNKSELATGYCTLYGDMCGGFAPIKDVYKTDVYAIARHINAGGIVIPERILTKAPTAELRPDQKDQDTLPPYDQLDSVLRQLVEDDKTPSQVNDTLAPAIARMVKAAEYKRRQGAIGPCLSEKPFGHARRYPIVNRFPLS